MILKQFLIVTFLLSPLARADHAVDGGSSSPQANCDDQFCPAKYPWLEEVSDKLPGDEKPFFVMRGDYAGADNFTGHKMYPEGLASKLYLSKECVQKFNNAGKDLRKRHGAKCKFVVFDAARPCSAQNKMRDFVTAPANKAKYSSPDDFVSNAKGCRDGAKAEDAQKVSMHNRGLAIDLTIDCSGEDDPTRIKEERDMGGKFDDPDTAKSNSKVMDNNNPMAEVYKKNRHRLYDVMVNGGKFSALTASGLGKEPDGTQLEWWHFNCMPAAQATGKPIIKNESSSGG